MYVRLLEMRPVLNWRTFVHVTNFWNGPQHYPLSHVFGHLVLLDFLSVASHQGLHEALISTCPILAVSNFGLELYVKSLLIGNYVGSFKEQFGVHFFGAIYWPFFGQFQGQFL